jgi:hypothetical protein
MLSISSARVIMMMKKGLLQGNFSKKNLTFFLLPECQSREEILQIKEEKSFDSIVDRVKCPQKISAKDDDQGFLFCYRLFASMSNLNKKSM